MTARPRRLSWIVIASVVLVGLVRASVDDGPPRTTEEQVETIARTMKCPICESQSVADSDVAASRAIRLEIATQVEKGRSAGEIREAISATYGERVQLIPPASGFAGLVWILPVVALIVALGALSAAFARWRQAPATAATEEDRALVDEALRHR
ncbi:MAG: cytochrome c-type biogenesis protein [Acidimicrobiales bacterium]